MTRIQLVIVTGSSTAITAVAIQRMVIRTQKARRILGILTKTRDEGIQIDLSWVEQMNDLISNRNAELGSVAMKLNMGIRAEAQNLGIKRGEQETSQKGRVKYRRRSKN